MGLEVTMAIIPEKATTKKKVKIVLSKPRKMLYQRIENE